MIDIKKLINKDLECYTQDSGFPQSLTVRDGITWRHYELDEIIGFVVWQDGNFIGLTSIEEDDMNFQPAHHPMYVSAFWTTLIHQTFTKMKEWIDENIDFKNNTLKHDI